MNDEMGRSKLTISSRNCVKECLFFCTNFSTKKGVERLSHFYAPVIEHLYKYTYATCVQ